MIEIRGLHKSFDELQVLKGIDLDVKNGEVLSVIGASGSGKGCATATKHRRRCGWTQPWTWASAPRRAQ